MFGVQYFFSVSNLLFPGFDSLRLIPLIYPSRNYFLRHRYFSLDIDKTGFLFSFFLAVSWHGIGCTKEYPHLIFVLLVGLSLGVGSDEKFISAFFLVSVSFLVLVCWSTSICLILLLFWCWKKGSVLIEGKCGLSGFVCIFLNKFALHNEGLRSTGQLSNSPTEARENTDGCLPRRRLVGY